MSIFKVFCYQKLPTHIWSILLTYKFIYTYMHIGDPISCHAYTCIYLKMNFHAIYLHLKGNSTSYIHLGSILVPFLTWVHFWKAPYANYPQIYIFWKAFLRYLSFIYRFWNALFATHSHFARYFYAIYSHTLQGIFMLYIYSHIYIPLKGIFHAT